MSRSSSATRSGRNTIGSTNNGQVTVVETCRTPSPALSMILQQQQQQQQQQRGKGNSNNSRRSSSAKRGRMSRITVVGAPSSSTPSRPPASAGRRTPSPVPLLPPPPPHPFPQRQPSSASPTTIQGGRHSAMGLPPPPPPPPQPAAAAQTMADFTSNGTSSSGSTTNTEETPKPAEPQQLTPLMMNSKAPKQRGAVPRIGGDPSSPFVRQRKQSFASATGTNNTDTRTSGGVLSVSSPSKCPSVIPSNCSSSSHSSPRKGDAAAAAAATGGGGDPNTEEFKMMFLHTVQDLQHAASSGLVSVKDWATIKSSPGPHRHHKRAADKQQKQPSSLKINTVATSSPLSVSDQSETDGGGNNNKTGMPVWRDSNGNAVSPPTSPSKQQERGRPTTTTSQSAPTSPSRQKQSLRFVMDGFMDAVQVVAGAAARSASASPSARSMRSMGSSSNNNSPRNNHQAEGRSQNIHRNTQGQHETAVGSTLIQDLLGPFLVCTGGGVDDHGGLRAPLSPPHHRYRRSTDSISQVLSWDTAAEDEALQLQRLTSWNTTGTAGTFGTFDTASMMGETTRSQMTGTPSSLGLQEHYSTPPPPPPSSSTTDGAAAASNGVSPLASSRAGGAATPASSSAFFPVDDDGNAIPLALLEVQMKRRKNAQERKRKQQQGRRKRVVQFDYPPISSLKEIARPDPEDLPKLFFTEEELDEIEADRCATNNIADDVEIVALSSSGGDGADGDGVPLLSEEGSPEKAPQQPPPPQRTRRRGLGLFARSNSHDDVEIPTSKSSSEWSQNSVGFGSNMMMRVSSAVGGGKKKKEKEQQQQQQQQDPPPSRPSSLKQRLPTPRPPMSGNSNVGSSAAPLRRDMTTPSPITTSAGGAALTFKHQRSTNNSKDPPAFVGTSPVPKERAQRRNSNSSSQNGGGSAATSSSGNSRILKGVQIYLRERSTKN